MRALWLDVPAETLAERRRLGIDVRDEVWDGVLHVPPSPSSTHMRRELDLAIALTPIARPRGLEVWFSTGMYGPHGSVNNYRIPDNAVARPDHRSRRGLESAELAVEWLSPHDESRDKFAFYAGAGVREIWLIDPRSRALDVNPRFGGAFPRPLAAGDDSLGRARHRAVAHLKTEVADRRRRLHRGGLTSTSSSSRRSSSREPLPLPLYPTPRVSPRYFLGAGFFGAGFLPAGFFAPSVSSSSWMRFAPSGSLFLLTSRYLLNASIALSL